MTVKTFVDPGLTFELGWTSEPMVAPQGSGDWITGTLVFQTDQPMDSVVTLEGRLAPEGQLDGMDWFPIVSHTRAAADSADKSQASAITTPRVLRVRTFGGGAGVTRAWIGTSV